MTVPTGPMIRGVLFEADGAAVIEYCHPATDAKQNGVLLNHTLFVPGGADYDDEIDAVLQAARALLADVTEDLPVLEPVRPPRNRAEEDEEQDDEDDDEDDDDE